MAIHDVDKNNDQRHSPQPNMSDAHGERRSDGTVGITNKQDDSTGPSVTTKNGRILVFDGTVNRVLIGLSPDGTYGIWVSKPGEDVIGAFS